uniref:Divergent protein kinase domain 2B n=1 Tax=Podarcis muralis TaxID=64176 RepID=A0A670I0H4_PODMU
MLKWQMLVVSTWTISPTGINCASSTHSQLMHIPSCYSWCLRIPLSTQNHVIRRDNPVAQSSVGSGCPLKRIFPGAEGWPFPKYLGSCGRLIVTTSTRPLKEFYGSSSDVAADLALQLLAIINSMRNNDLNYLFYFTHVDAGTFGVFNSGHLFIRDASTLGVIDKQEGKQLMDGQEEHKDIFSCLVTDCQSELPSCNSIKDTRSLIMVCEELLPKLLKEKFLPPVQEKIDRALSRCADSFLTDQEVIRAAQVLEEILQPLQTCDPRFAYRYPDCKYRDKP